DCQLGKVRKKNLGRQQDSTTELSQRKSSNCLGSNPGKQEAGVPGAPRKPWSEPCPWPLLFESSSYIAPHTEFAGSWQPARIARSDGTLTNPLPARAADSECR